MSKELSEFLKLRRGKHSIREIATSTGISNAYLSQLETGVAKQPSPSILHKLAAAYNCSYEELMRLAGYIQARAQNAPASPLEQAQIAFMQTGMTADQVKQIMDFADFVRNKNRQA